MIIQEQPIALASVSELVKTLESKPIHDYLKKFSKLSKKESDKLLQDLANLNNSKLKQTDLVKIADFLPQDQEELNKILLESGLNEEESNAILEIVRKY